MIKTLIAGAAVSALMVSGAMAQSPPSPSATPSTPPAASSPAPSSAGQAGIVSSQKPDQWLASKFRGTDVLGPDNQKIGDVSDILFDKAGKIEAFVVSVGGFLGMGAKSVALAPASFDVIAGQNGGPDQLKLAMSKEQLTQAQNFTPYEPPRATTTGAGGMGGAPRPAGSPSAR